MKGYIDPKSDIDVPPKYSIEVLLQLWVHFVITTNPIHETKLTLFVPYVGKALLQGRGVNNSGGASFATGANGFVPEHAGLLPVINSFLPDLF